MLVCHDAGFEPVPGTHTDSDKVPSVLGETDPVPRRIALPTVSTTVSPSTLVETHTFVRRASKSVPNMSERFAVMVADESAMSAVLFCWRGAGGWSGD